MEGSDWQAKVAEVEATKAVAIRDAELQMEVKTKNVLCQTDKLKVEQLSKSTVHYDTQVGYAISMCKNIVLGTKENHTY